MTGALRRCCARLANLVRPDRAERELARELASHLALLEDEYRRRGLAAEEARRRARVALGGVDQTKERHRETRSFAWLDDARRDAGYAARMLRRNPGAAATAMVSLAIGIGANSAIFSVANALLFRGPAGVARPDRLVDIGTARGDGGFNPASFPTYVDVRDRTGSFAGVYAQQMFPQALTVDITGRRGTPERAFGRFVTSNYFTTLGVRAAGGRVFDPADPGQPGANPVLVLSHAFWARRYNGGTSAIGSTIHVNGQPFTVLGVAPDGFQGTGVTAADVWIPLSMFAGTTGQSDAIFAAREGGWLVMGARLKPGVPTASAAAEVDALGKVLALERGSSRTGGAELRLLPASSVPGNRAAVAVFIALLMGMVALVLIVACANVSGVLLARAAARRREIAVRLSLGAGRARLVRQLLTEAMMLFLLGGAGGLVLARVLTSLLVTWLSALPFPVVLSLTLDGRVTSFTIGLSLLAALAAGLAPALQTTKARPVEALKADSQGPSARSWIRQAFVVAQVALSVALVVGAGLFARALVRAGAADPGFDPQGIELTSLDVPAGSQAHAARLAFWRGLLDRVRDVPGVQVAALARVVPGGFEGIGLGLGPVGGGIAPDDFEPDGNIVEPGYFATLRIPIVAGRDFTTADRAGAQPVVIVGENAARHYWPGRSAVGQYLSQRIEGGMRRYLVIGVVRDIRSTSLVDGLAESFVYLPLQQQIAPTFTSSMTIVTRTSPGESVASPIRRAVASIDPDLPMTTSRTLYESLALGLMPQRLAASIAGSLGAVGLLLAAIGIYGVTAFTVTRRLRELGIRVALGAQRGDILRIVVRQALGLTLSGCAIGVLLAAAAAQVLSAFLLGAPALDPVTFAGAVALFVAAGLAACYGPARRAITLDPLSVLRHD